VSPKLKALPAIAAKVQESGRQVAATDIDNARAAGATDTEIHDAVLIAAAFCMFNLYVDGLATFTPRDEDACDQMGQRMAQRGICPGHP
jgi:alkylhydroperoxidase/carboxymuconolactone decarboxylase family protein YurZ